MRPGDLSTLAASLTGSDLPTGARCVLLSIAAATGPDRVAHLSATRLGERCGLSRGHVQRLLRILLDGGFIGLEVVPGRASKLVVRLPETCSAGAPPTGSAGALGVAHERATGSAPARHISGNTPSQLPTRCLPTDPGGSVTPAWDSAFVADNGTGVLDAEHRRAAAAAIRRRIQGGDADAG